MYMDDLLALDSFRPNKGIPPLAHPVLASRPPLPVEAWRYYLCNHPDKRFAEYILRGLSDGFRIGFDRSHRTRPSSRNMKSAYDNKAVVSRYIADETQCGRLIRFPATPPWLSCVHLSPFGVIPKKGTNKWRLIVDLSSPHDASVNDGIDPSLTSIRYSSIDDAVRIVQELGNGSLMAKLDLKAAYRSVPVHLEDRLLLGTRWEESIFVDTALPFGLSSAPKIFSAVADALLWIMLAKGVNRALHYLDDFIFFGRPSLRECQSAFDIGLQTCAELGWEAHKVEGPSTCLVFLGIEIDSVESQLRLPQDKLGALRMELGKWRGRKTCTKKELLSLIGHLGHASKVVKPGRTFLRRLIDLSTSVKELHHHIRLNASARADIAWWWCFGSQWNGVSLLAPPSPSVSLFTDASGAWGCGGLWSPHWFHFQWPPEWVPLHIAVKELLPIVVSAATWGCLWRGRSVLCFSDNMAVVYAVNKRSVKCPSLMHLLRALFFIEAHFSLLLKAEHIAGVANSAADHISRDNMREFFVSCPQADPLPSPLPEGLLPLLLNLQQGWPSPSWCQQLSATLRSR